MKRTIKIGDYSTKFEREGRFPREDPVCVLPVGQSPLKEGAAAGVVSHLIEGSGARAVTRASMDLTRLVNAVERTGGLEDVEDEEQVKENAWTLCIDRANEMFGAGDYAKAVAKKAMKQILGESKQRLSEDGYKNMRFDTNARVEVFLDQDELEDECYELRHSDSRPVEEKIVEAKKIAVKLANDRISSVRGLEITCYVSLEDVNLDRIDWVALVTNPDDDE